MERQIRYYRKPSRAQKVEILYCEELLAKNKEQGVHNCAILFNVPYSIKPLMAAYLGEGCALSTNIRRVFRSKNSQHCHVFSTRKLKKDQAWHHTLRKIGYSKPIVEFSRMSSDRTRKVFSLPFLQKRKEVSYG